MNFDDIQQQATIDLARFIAVNHFDYRGHTPEAYREIADPLIQNRLGLTGRELAAAKALASWATFEIEDLKITKALVTNVGETPKYRTDEQPLRIAAIEHLARQAAHTYAEHVGDLLLLSKWPLPVWNPTSKPQPATATPAPLLADSDSNSTTPDPERRLTRLRALGGNAAYKHGKWKITGITALVASEKTEGCKRSDEKTIRVDLKEAAENEREAKRANAFSGLGQR